jgi:mono/diheme cytochrome c family protein
MVPNHLKYLTLPVASALALLLAATVPSTALAQGPGHAPVQMTGGIVTTGRLEFRQYCAPCHGMDGTGDGPVAASLKTKPANLTMVAKNNGGVFPTKEVYDTITGNTVVAGHGTREMPIWGTVFRTGNIAPGQRPRGPEAIKRMVDPLVAYIESIQVK